MRGKKSDYRIKDKANRKTVVGRISVNSRGFGFLTAAASVSQYYASARKDESNHADETDSRQNAHLQECKGNACRQSVDAGSQSKG